MAFITLGPLIAVAWRALAGGGDEGNIVTDVTSIQELPQVLLNTLVLVIAAGAASLLIGGALAWLSVRTDAGMGLFSDAMPMVPYLLPPIAGAVAWTMLLSPGAGFINAWLRDFVGIFGVEMSDGPFNIYSWFGLILVMTIYQVPYAFLLISAGLRNMDSTLEEQSRVSGVGLGGTFFRVTLPALTPSIAGAALLVTWSGLALYSVPAVIGTGANIKVLTVLIVEQLTTYTPSRTGAAVGLSLIMVALIGVVWFIQSVALRRGRFASISGKARAATPLRLGRWRGVARVCMIGYAVVTTGLPVLALVLVTLNGYWTPNLKWADFSLDPFFDTVLGSSRAAESLQNSLGLGLVGATIGITAAAVIALFVARLPVRLGRVIDGALKLPPTMSHIVLAVGFVLLFAGPPFRLSGTVVILLLAYIALYFPQGSVAADGAVVQIGKDLPEASAVSGASESTTFRKIYLPLMLPGLIAGWTLLFVRIVGDLTASAVLAGPGNPVVGRQILEIYQNGSFAQLAALATALTIVTTVLVIIAMLVQKRTSRWSSSTSTVITTTN